ncbi:cytochrome P450 [Boletus edulis BED1]|uniref:Cytochrome P450 n=1 Tax=Boletus edulis BED1 TaxID=1328754 RepID=A0AAD4C174_BOLED|nr:cytochrome P450 [Boletus edulis BED1]
MPFLVFDVCLAGLAVYLVVRLFGRRSPPLPPGPPGWPLIGNMLDIRTRAPYKTIGAMTSPIIYLRVLGTQFVFLNSIKANKDLFEEQGAITPDRPPFTVAGNLIRWGNAMPFLPYGDTLRKQRKLFSRHIGTHSSLVMLYPEKEAEARRFVSNVLKKPDDLMAHCRTMATSLGLKIAHGYSPKDEGDPFVEIASRIMQCFAVVTSPGLFLADFLPILVRYIPNRFLVGRFRKDLEEGRKLLSDALNAPYQFALENLATGDTAPSLTSRLLQEGVDSEDEEILKWVSLAMYLGTSESIPSMLYMFFLAMTMYPEVLKKAQAEVDAVVGNDRLPKMEDRDALPYVNAVCTELLRWNVFLPSPFHIASQDITYEGYFIPRGAWLLPNIWFLLSDPETYPDPEIFNPERFLGGSQQPDPREACFGLGRRVCPGARLAECAIFICITTSLATLNVSRCVENGVECVPRYEFQEGFLRRVKPFKCKITPRSKKAGDLIED